jgi:tRNA pseudouridine13 synthase
LAEAQAIELQALEGEEFWREGLEQAGLEQERRSLILPVNSLRWEWPDKGALQLQFALAPGAYATAVLREVLLASAAGVQRAAS